MMRSQVVVKHEVPEDESFSSLDSEDFKRIWEQFKEDALATGNPRDGTMLEDLDRDSGDDYEPVGSTNSCFSSEDEEETLAGTIEE
jgi:hypothetical protein